MVPQLKQELLGLLYKFETVEDVGFDKIFNFLNSDDMLGLFIDLHGQSIQKSVEIASQYLFNV